MSEREIRIQMKSVQNENEDTFPDHFVGVTLTKDGKFKKGSYMPGGVKIKLKDAAGEFVYIVDGEFKGLAGTSSTLSQFTGLDEEDLLDDAEEYLNFNSKESNARTAFDFYANKNRAKRSTALHFPEEDYISYTSLLSLYLSKTPKANKTMKRTNVYKHHPEILGMARLGDKLEGISEGKVLNVSQFSEGKPPPTRDVPTAKSKLIAVPGYEFMVSNNKAGFLAAAAKLRDEGYEEIPGSSMSLDDFEEAVEDLDLPNETVKRAVNGTAAVPSKKKAVKKKPKKAAAPAKKKAAAPAKKKAAAPAKKKAAAPAKKAATEAPRKSQAKKKKPPKREEEEEEPEEEEEEATVEVEEDPESEEEDEPEPIITKKKGRRLSGRRGARPGRD